MYAQLSMTEIVATVRVVEFDLGWWCQLSLVCICKITNQLRRIAASYRWAAPCHRLPGLPAEACHLKQRTWELGLCSTLRVQRKNIPLRCPQIWIPRNPLDLLVSWSIKGAFCFQTPVALFKARGTRVMGRKQYLVVIVPVWPGGMQSSMATSPERGQE